MVIHRALNDIEAMTVFLHMSSELWTETLRNTQRDIYRKKKAILRET